MVWWCGTHAEPGQWTLNFRLKSKNVETQIIAHWIIIANFCKFLNLTSETNIILFNLLY